MTGFSLRHTCMYRQRYTHPHAHVQPHANHTRAVPEAATEVLFCDGRGTYQSSLQLFPLPLSSYQPLSLTLRHSLSPPLTLRISSSLFHVHSVQRTRHIIADRGTEALVMLVSGSLYFSGCGSILHTALFITTHRN